VKYLKALFDTPIFYVQISSDELVFKNVQTGQIITDVPLVAFDITYPNKVVAIGSNAKQYQHQPNYKVIAPFSHPRLLLADFMAGEKLLQYIFASQLPRFSLPPKVIFHPMEKVEGGLTYVEERAFKELCLGAGARDCVVYVGHSLLHQSISVMTIVVTPV
jgi:rod shape-determining protein MreB